MKLSIALEKSYSALFTALLYETLLYETLRVACFHEVVRQAQGIALRVACFHEVVRQAHGIAFGCSLSKSDRTDAKIRPTFTSGDVFSE
ncbi:hypothetical protein [Nostoc sp.]|uniref:hypothetical protein n=1 Tax=Nostoc sp. TaxID=1180 RepID=UPI002FF62C7B